MILAPPTMMPVKPWPPRRDQRSKYFLTLIRARSSELLYKKPEFGYSTIVLPGAAMLLYPKLGGEYLSHTRRGDSSREYSASHNGCVFEEDGLSIVDRYSETGLSASAEERVPLKRPPFGSYWSFIAFI